MPFINGRYYINPVMGEALEAAREAEAALAALENRAHDDSGLDNEPTDDAGKKTKAEKPIHRVEIEAAEVVPAHSGRATRGFVARVHRQAANPAPSGHGDPMSHTTGAGHAETHVFSDHRDLVSFLRDELGRDELSKDSRSRRRS
jgi:hypothetical protein